MSKITLEITEVVNGVSITETPITLQGELLAAASTTATGVTFTPTGGIAATNVQAALAELDTEKLNLSGGTIDGDVTLIGTGLGKNVFFDKSENLLKVADGVTFGFGSGNAVEDIDLEIFHVSNQSYIRDTGAGTLFIQTDGPGITLGGTTNNNIVSGTFIPGAEVTLYHNSNAKITTTANGVDVTGLVEFDSLSGTGSVAITDILDADDMSGASATTLSTSESIKAYVDNQVAGKDNTDEITEGSTNLYFTNARADARIAEADTGDLSEGSNLYFTNARADARIAAANTGDLSEGSNLYFTNARADARIAAATTTDLTEGTQLYFTNTRADARIAANLIDEDGFGTDSATRAPSQQSVKAYVAARTANIQGTITNVITGNGLIGGGTSGAVTIAVDTAVTATTSNTIAMNNKTLNTPVLNSPDINGGTMDGVTIGETSRSTGKFTTLDTTNGIVFTDAGALGTATATSNTLDAYEEGTWDPAVRDAETGGNAATMLAATGHYTLIGNQCTLIARLINIDPGDGSPSAPTGANTIYITGLPFAPANLPTGVRHIGSMESTAITYENSIQPRVLENANFIVISNSQNNGSLSTLDFDALNTSAADIFLQVTYTV